MSEPVAWLWLHNGKPRSALLYKADAFQDAYWISRGFTGQPLYLHPAPDHHEAMQMALEALETAQPYVADYCKNTIVMAHNEAITALRAALGEKG